MWRVLIFLAGALIFVEGLNLYKDISAMNWPASIGQLSYIYTPAPTSYSIPEYGPIFHPLRQRDVLFSYEVNGRSYESDNLSFGLTLSENVETVGSGKAGHAKVKVYFNPSDPEEAVLIPGPKVINVGLLAIGILSFFWLFRQIMKSKSTQGHGEWRQE